MENPEDRNSRVIEQEAAAVKIANSIAYIISGFGVSDHSKINKTDALKTAGSLTKVESIAECSLGAFCNTFDLR